MAFNAPLPILPLYSRAPIAPSLPRRVAVVLAQLAAAAAYGFAAVGLPPQNLYLLFVPVVVCLLIALWLMPDRGIFPRTAIERTFRVLLILTIIWPTYIAIVLPGLPWLTPTRIALFVLTFLFLYGVSTSSLLRRHVSLVARSSPLVWRAFLVWQASMFVSIPFSSALSYTFKALVDNQLRFTVVFFASCLVFARRDTPRRTIGWIVVLAVVCAIDGFWELKLGYPPWANHIPSFMKVDEATMAVVLGAQSRSADGLYRVHGPFPNSLLMAEYLALSMPFILHWLLTGRTHLLRLAMLIAFAVVLYAILSTQSRLGLVGTIIGVAIYVPLWALRQYRADRTSLVGPSILFGAPFIALLLIGLVFSSHTLSTRVLGGGAQAASTQARVDQRRMAVPKVLRNPLGYGLDQSGHVLGFVNQAGAVTVDNHYITSLLEIGVVGTLGFYGMFLVAAWLGVRLYLTTNDREMLLAGPLAVMFIGFVIEKSVLSQENNHSLVVLLLAMMLTLWGRARGLFDPDNPFPPAAEPR